MSTLGVGDEPVEACRHTIPNLAHFRILRPIVPRFERNMDGGFDDFGA